MSEKGIVEQQQDVAVQAAQELTRNRIRAVELSRDIVIHTAYAKLATVGSVRALAELKESKGYKGLEVDDADGNCRRVGSWEEYCNHIGLSRSTVDEQIANLNKLGEDFFEYNNRLELFNTKQLRMMRKLPDDDRQAIIEHAKSESTSKEDVLEILEEAIIKHDKERQQLKHERDEAREDCEAARKVSASKEKQLNHVSEELEKVQNRQRNMKPADVAESLKLNMNTIVVAAESEISKLKDAFEALIEHAHENDMNHDALMVGALNQIIRDCETLRERFALPMQPGTSSIPEWVDMPEWAKTEE